MKITTISQEELEKQPQEKAERNEMMEIIDKYIMGEPIEREVNISKIKVILRAPSVEIVNDLYKTIAKASEGGYVNMQVESASGLLSAYVRYFNGHDFLEELGEEYDTVEGKQKIRSFLNNRLIEPVRDALSEKVLKFYEDLKEAFSSDSLDFS